MRRALVLLSALALLGACKSAETEAKDARARRAERLTWSTTTTTSEMSPPSQEELDRYLAGARDLEAVETCLRALINHLDVDTSFCEVAGTPG